MEISRQAALPRDGGIGEGRFRFTWKPDDDVDPDGNAGTVEWIFPNEGPEEGRIVVPVHGGPGSPSSPLCKGCGDDGR